MSKRFLKALRQAASGEPDTLCLWTCGEALALLDRLEAAEAWLAALDAGVATLREAVRSARELAMRVGDGKHELSAKASVVYSHASATLAATAALVQEEKP